MTLLIGKMVSGAVFTRDGWPRAREIGMRRNHIGAALRTVSRAGLAIALALQGSAALAQAAGEAQSAPDPAEAVNGDEAKVVAAFVAAGNPHRLEWKFKKVDGDWKISDLLSVTGEWALSQYQCE